METRTIAFEDAKICIECQLVYHKNCESKHAPNVGPCGHKAGIRLTTYIELMAKQGKEVCCAD